MKSSGSTAVALVACLALPVVVHAEDVIDRLPEDGAWAEFEYEGTSSNVLAGITGTFAGTCRLSSLGTVEVDGIQCRWIEIATKDDIHAGRKVTDGSAQNIFKILIPEGHLGAGKDISAVKAWHWNSEMPVRPRRVARLDEQTWIGPILDIFTRRSLPPNAKELEVEFIETKLGKFECKGIFASRRTYGPNGEVTLHEYTIRMHEKPPFGIIAVDYRMTIEHNEKILVAGASSMRLADVGDGAESALPDAN